MSYIIFEWLSTIFFLTGAFIYTGKRQKFPKTRLIGFCFYIVGGIIFITLNLLYGSYPFAITQIVFTVFDLRGIYYAYKEIKDNK